MQMWSVLIIVRLYCTTPWVKKNNKTPNSCPHLRQILIDFRHFFTVTLGRKFAIKRSIQIQPNIKVATLPCEILVSKNCSDWQHSSSTPSAHTVKECDRDWRAAVKQLWRDRNLAFSTSHSTICDRKAVAALAIDKAGIRSCHFRPGPTSGPATRPGSQKSKISTEKKFQYV